MFITHSGQEYRFFYSWNGKTHLGMRTLVYLPGHKVVQAIFCTLCPSQKAPPLSGAGLVQVLVRF